jgi:serine phosphatase RsbU (regulator of sigma subunit)
VERPEPQPNGTAAPASAAGADAASTPLGVPFVDATAGRLAATVHRLHNEVAAAAASADARALIDLAKGMLMERLGCGPADATDQLDQLAHSSRRPVLELAADIVNQIADDTLSKLAAAPTQVESLPPDTSVRLRSAQTGVLDASETQTAAQALLAHALSPLGATAVAVWALSADGSLNLAGHAGLPRSEAIRWRHVPPGVTTLARHAVTQRRIVWTTGAAALQAPSPSLGRAAAGFRAAVPAELYGRLLGVLEVFWPGESRDLPAQIDRQLQALAELCGHTLDTLGGPEAAASAELARDSLGEDAATTVADSMFDPVMVLEPIHGAQDDVIDFAIVHTNDRFEDLAGRPRATITGMSLVRAYPEAAVSGLFVKVEHVYATGETFKSEKMALATSVDRVPLSIVAAVGICRVGRAVLLTWRLDQRDNRLATLLNHAQRLGRIGGFEDDLVTGETLWNAELFGLYGLPPTAAPVPLKELTGFVYPDDADSVTRFLRTVLHHRAPASVAVRLRRTDGVLRYMRIVAEPVTDSHGTLIAVRGACQDVSSQHWTEIALAATRDQLDQSEQRAAERNRLALQLQQAIMPSAPTPVEAFGLRVAVRYRPAEKEHLVGGDWYDTALLPNKSLLLTIGDVAGHGIDAATDMVALRNALRGLAVTGAGPAQLLGWLNSVAHHLTDMITATAVCGIYDPASGTLRWARAGHLPPLLVRDGEARALPLPTGMLLGAMAEATYQEAVVHLSPGDILVMYTDGLIERRDRSLDASLEHLLAATRSPVSSLGDLLDRMLVHSISDTDDDTCLIGIQAV